MHPSKTNRWEQNLAVSEQKHAVNGQKAKVSEQKVAASEQNKPMGAKPCRIRAKARVERSKS
ncbi:hypothetical protein [Lysinibacillus sp. LZ02]|uniref:hypothetical protein n=1 Tax=Lysinibacillus sp. LZ02 TaxID=3420668 RepID=UPI003D35F0A4